MGAVDDIGAPSQKPSLAAPRLADRPSGDGRRQRAPHERFEVLRQLGQGGMGVVRLARDRVRGELVALKTLRATDPDTLYRFKREFRALAYVRHPNLVRVHELIGHGGSWHLVMEYIDGVDVMTYLLQRARSGGRDAPTVPLDESLVADARGRVECHHDGYEQAGDRTRVPAASGCGDEDRVRHVFGQLATALIALHDAGKLHKDLKPSNALVTVQGRVVLVDFGMVSERFGRDSRVTLDDRAFGTPAYMAPEQAAGDALTAAVDWYAFGVMLYEALTGALPFLGSMLDVIVRKQSERPPALLSQSPDAPADLAALCMGLLEPDPAQRFGRQQVIEYLGLRPVGLGAACGERWQLEGRAGELTVLKRAAARARAGQATVIGMYGASGMGKSALGERLCCELDSLHRGVVLRGACYQHEAMPLKGIDTLVDSLGRHLKRMSEPDLRRLLPDSTFALAGVFPVLRKVPAIERAFRSGLAALCEVDVAATALEALARILHALAACGPISLFVDDLHWCDADSRRFLVRLLAERAVPNLMLVYTWRGGREGDPLGACDLGADTERKFLHVGALDMLAMLSLAQRLVGEGGERAATVSLAQLAAGSPARLIALAGRKRLEWWQPPTDILPPLPGSSPRLPQRRLASPAA